MWLRKEALAVEETPNYLPAVRVKLNNPGVGKAGLWERHKSVSPGMLRHTGPTAMKGAGMSWQTALGRELCPSISAHQGRGG